MIVSEFLRDLDLEQYVDAFEENAIDAETLALLTNDDLKELGVAALGHRKKITNAIANLAGGQPELPAPVPDQVAPKPADTRPGENDGLAGGERRQVTVLFADISGFTKLSSTLDAEEIREMLNLYFEAVDGIIGSFGGTVDKHIGDAVMAIFGAPIAHSNDPERAVRAALEIHQAVKKIDPPITVHIGIASGQVVASSMGSDRHQEYTITGDSVNLASRLQDLAKSGETYLSDAVRSVLASQIRCTRFPAVSIQGLDRDVTVWRLEEFGASSGAANKTGFVGRGNELRQFKGVIEDCLETRRGQTVYVRGEAGIGKSRLLEEVEELATSAGFARHKSLVLDFGVGKGQDAIRILVRGLLELPSVADKHLRARAADKAIEAGLVARERRVHLNDLLDLEQPTELRSQYDAMDNDNRNRGKRETVVELVTGSSLKQPLFIQIEDIHWANGIVLNHAASLAAAVPDIPVVLVLTSRFDGDPINHAWRSSADGAALTTIDLGQLRAEEAMGMAGDYVEISKRIAEECIKRADGNPLFLEQLLRGAEESTEESVPGSVQSIVLSRMDRLDAIDKQALQTAAVIGARFPLDLLRHLMGSGQYTCSALVDHAFVKPQEGGFLFQHALVRDGAYSSLLKSRRRELHERAAAWFEDRDLELRALHLDRAESPLAGLAYSEAARFHSDHYRFDTALDMIRRGLALAEGADARYRLLMAQGENLRESGKAAESIEVYRTALSETDLGAEQCRSLIGLAAGMRVTDDYDGALEALDQAEILAAADGLDIELSDVHYYRGSIFFPLARIEGGLAQHLKALDAAERAGEPEREARALSGLGDAYYASGRFLTALKYYERCIALSRAHGFGRVAVGNAYMVSWIRVYMSDMVTASTEAELAVESAAQARHQRAEMVARVSAARVQVERGLDDEALEHISRGFELAELLGANRFKPFLTIYWAYAREGQGAAHGPVLTALQDALAIAHETGIGFLGPWVLGVSARFHASKDESLAALAEGEKLLAGECVGHNYGSFYRDAMDVALRYLEWDEAERYADALEAYTRSEPIPYSDFMIQRTRLLARHGRGDNGAWVVGEFQRLTDVAEAGGMLVQRRVLERALHQPR
jgi:class 3 adenylate cyclase/tetratricopeptide (TPR) repeat protein